MSDCTDIIKSRLGPLSLRHCQSKYVENELRPQCPTYDFHAGISLELVLFTYSCCVAVLDSKVVSIGWENGLGGVSNQVQDASRTKARARRPVNIQFYA